MTKKEIIDIAFQFVESINRADLDRLINLMTDDHTLYVFGEHDVSGRENQREAWKGYFDLCPEYMIHIHRVYVRGDMAVLVGSTTGSHLNLPRAEEFNDPLIWTAKIRDGKVSEWALHYLNDENRMKFGID